VGMSKRRLYLRQEAALSFIRSEVKCPSCGGFHRSGDGLLACIDSHRPEDKSVELKEREETRNQIHDLFTELSHVIASAVFRDTTGLPKDPLFLPTRLVCISCLPELDFVTEIKDIHQQALDGVDDAVHHVSEKGRLRTYLNIVRYSYMGFSLLLVLVLYTAAYLTGSWALLPVGGIAWAATQAIHLSGKHNKSESTINLNERMLVTAGVVVATLLLYFAA
jgi:hypothetical protein